MGSALGAVASVVGIGSGLNSMFGGSSGGSSSGGSTSSGTYDPYGQYRGQAASQLNTLMNNPSLAMAQPGYQQQLQQGMEQSQRGAAATGMLQSGAEANALQQQGQNTFSSYYNAQLANLMQLSGASQSPAAAGLSQQQAANAAYGRQASSIGQITSGLGGLATSGMFGSSSGSGSSWFGSDLGGYTSSQVSSGANQAVPSDLAAEYNASQY